MAQLTVNSSSHTYLITIDKAIRFDLKSYLDKTYSSILIITDDKVATLYLNDIKRSLPKGQLYDVVVPAGEQSKSASTYFDLQTKAIEFGLDRQSLIIALGGGVVGDLAGFVAATYMRGIDYVQVPTTILAHDSSVGGKVAINHQLGKNLIGNFYPPKAVVYDVETLQTLSQSEVRSGYAELIKEALISNRHFFSDLLETSLLTITSDQLKDHLLKGIKIKAKVVEADEKESGVRKYLNLGHTLAHAIESELGYGKLTHGEAVAIGLLFALHISENIFETELPYNSLFNWMKENHYPIHMPNITSKALIDRMKLDKKAVDNKVQMVLLQTTSNPTVIGVSDKDLYLHLKTFIGRLV